ncbi:FAD:protein FMN transferase [Pseudotabrizicola alkalilacus]|uniref:FAD:protein FMN transferase n=1 Tax=Pseudotabrizicola alkalilacus TaxID=2305252 RepID=A0A411Z4S1_9RHOB|nr:FAD:protein FMN transferase [Pseudotabrizicola alkalilacus]RGP38051.1 FAD:protein FMN transferase [Pseudotabrizicola alkalilacus]
MNRRRFLSITAAAMAVPQMAPAETLWQGGALGADASLRLSGRTDHAQAALDGLRSLLGRVEATFSLYRPSELTRLNRTGAITPSDWFRQVVDLSGTLHRQTGGAFDPSVQPLWQGWQSGQLADPALLGWDKVQTGSRITLMPGQALTFNGIAQGFATDLVRAHLARHGFDHALINIGEYAALGGPFRLGISDPQAGLLADWHLTGGALAVSSPMATLIAGRPHIQHPRGLPPLWATVAVQADSAAVADGLSTALVFLSRSQIASVTAARPDIRRVALVDAAGNLETL